MRIRIFIFLLLIALLASCTVTKFVPDGEYLLDKVEVKSDTNALGVNPSEMRQLVRQRGNSRWFSAAKLPLATYSLSGRDTTKWFNRFLRSIGEPPQLYDSVSTRASMDILQTQLQNMGYLRASVDVYNKIKGKKLVTTYLLHPRQPYFINKVDYDIRDSAIAVVLNLADSTRRGLKSGMMFNVANLDNERSRISKYLTNRGYYRFNKDFISYRADSVPGSPLINLTLVLDKYRSGEETNLPHQVYTIGDVNFRSGNPNDSVIPLRQSFGRLGAVRYTNISFHEHEFEPVLDCDILVSTNKPSTISFQPEGTNTSGDLGAAVSLTYQNRNIFHGSENLSVVLRGAYEAIRGLEGYSNTNFQEYSVETSLSFPRFIAPLLSTSFRRRVNASSEVSLLYDLQNRPEFMRRVFSVAWRYKWNDQNHHDRYQVDLLDLNYISMPWISDTFKAEYLDNTDSRNSILRYNYENLFIMKLGFGYTYNNGRYAIKVSAESAGNLLNLASHMFHFHKNSEEQYTFLDIAYAQYLRGIFDYTRNFVFDYHNQLVFHFGFGIAYPYGNSTILPFEKRFFSGGANSVRGWSVRSLGPGKFIGRDGRIDFINQTGDMKLDLNLEYRASLFWKFGGALFIDAGNIWTLRDYEDQPGGQFKISEFWQQIAVSYGLGLRLNFDYFVVRFDMGMKAVNPAYEDEKDHFPILHPRLSRDFAFHFAVGLPF